MHRAALYDTAANSRQLLCSVPCCLALIYDKHARRSLVANLPYRLLARTVFSSHVHNGNAVPENQTQCYIPSLICTIQKHAPHTLRHACPHISIIQPPPNPLSHTALSVTRLYTCYGYTTSYPQVFPIPYHSSCNPLVQPHSTPYYTFATNVPQEGLHPCVMRPIFASGHTRAQNEVDIPSKPPSDSDLKSQCWPNGFNVRLWLVPTVHT